MKAWIADLAPGAARASLFGVFNWVIGVTAFPASLLAGWLWQRYSPAAPFALSSVLAFLAAVLLLWV
jgi:MFS family permease